MKRAEWSERTFRQHTGRTFYHDRLPLALLEKLSVGFIATTPDTEPRDVAELHSVSDGSLALVYAGQDGKIYKLPRALPRAFLVPQILAVSNSDEALTMLLDRNFNAHQAAIIIGENAASKTGLPLSGSSGSEIGGTSTIVEDRLNEVAVDVNAPQRGVLVLNDSWDAGWKVRVDGVEQELLKVNYNFRGVVVPPGSHRVVFRYRPKFLLAGLAISGLSMFLLLAFCGAECLRRWRYGQPSAALPRKIAAAEGKC